jgi:hypothetical protein
MKVTSTSYKELEIKIGSEVFVPCRNRGGHGAWVEVTKINKMSFKGIECKGSYTPGTEWSVHKNATFAVVERPEGKGWIKHWIND